EPEGPRPAGRPAERARAHPERARDIRARLELHAPAPRRPIGVDSRLVTYSRLCPCPPRRRIHRPHPCVTRGLDRRPGFVEGCAWGPLRVLFTGGWQRRSIVVLVGAGAGLRPRRGARSPPRRGAFDTVPGIPGLGLAAWTTGMPGGIWRRYANVHVVFGLRGGF